MATLVHNKKAGFNYELLENYEAGLDLLGFEVKSLKAGRGSLEGSYIIIRGNEAFLVGAHIPPFQPANTKPDYDPYRNRRLLLTRKEIGQLAGKEKEKGLTLVPISVYNKGKLLKLKLAVAKGKKKYDKRETIKQREAKREIDRTLKNSR